MAAKTISSREFNHAASQAKKAASSGPVFITDRGRPSHVLLSIEDYQKLSGEDKTLAEVFGSPEGVEDVELEIPAMPDSARPADLS